MRILRVVGSRTLACGCFVGTYETYGGRCVEFIDHVATRCTVAEHRLGPRGWLARSASEEWSTPGPGGIPQRERRSNEDVISAETATVAPKTRSGH
jgi:hypothetical protein